MANKAHTAVVRRISERYGAKSPRSGNVDVHAGDLFVEVETTATMRDGIERLRRIAGRRYIAVTNREALDDAVSLTGATGIGVMDPWGDVVRDAEPTVPG